MSAVTSRAVTVFLVIPAVLFAILVTLPILAITAIIDPEKCLRIALGYDRAGNAAFNGDPRQTISYRASTAMSEGKQWGCILCKALDAVDPNHCQNAVLPDTAPFDPATTV